MIEYTVVERDDMPTGHDLLIVEDTRHDVVIVAIRRGRLTASLVTEALRTLNAGRIGARAA